ncbi:hypothetical protein PFISCL1PPCAC_16994, partial [Pristionchus fissidentatus]
PISAPVTITVSNLLLTSVANVRTKLELEAAIQLAIREEREIEEEEKRRREKEEEERKREVEKKRREEEEKRKREEEKRRREEEERRKKEEERRHRKQEEKRKEEDEKKREDEQPPTHIFQKLRMDSNQNFASRFTDDFNNPKKIGKVGFGVVFAVKNVKTDRASEQRKQGYERAKEEIPTGSTKNG